MGACEACADKKGPWDCWNNGLPMAGGVECESVCFDTFGEKEMDADFEKMNDKEMTIARTKANKKTVEGEIKILESDFEMLEKMY